MQPDNQIRTRYCNNCKKRISMTHFDVHSAVCLPKLETPARKRKFKLKAHNSCIRTHPQPQNEDLIPCHLCGFSQTLEQLDTHPGICPNRQLECSYCKYLFPKKMMVDHLLVCPQKTARIDKQQQDQSTESPKFIIKQDDISKGNHYEVSFLSSEKSDKSSRMRFFLKKQQDKKQTRKTQDRKRSTRHQEEGVVGPQRVHLQRASNNMYLDGLLNMRRILNQLEDANSIMNYRIQQLASRNNQKKSEGLLKEEIKLIKERQFKQKRGQELEDCSICCCVIVENHMVKDLPCNHLYHTECLSKWLAKNTACPLCKFDISTLVKAPSSDKKSHLQDFTSYIQSQTEQSHLLLIENEGHD